MAFTFSFPVHQTAINAGTLMQWTKGYDVTGVVGEDVVSMLQKALQQKNVNIQVVALINDTVCNQH
jgi:hexokinase